MKDLLFSLLLMIPYLSSTAQIDNDSLRQAVYQENILKESINGVYIPQDIDDVFVELDKLSSPDSKQKIKEGQEDIVTERLSRGLGKWMIVHWNFYEGSRISHHLRVTGVSHPDDMASFLIISYYRYLNNLPLDIDRRAAQIKERRIKEQQERNKNRVAIDTLRH